MDMDLNADFQFTAIAIPHSRLVDLKTEPPTNLTISVSSVAVKLGTPIGATCSKANLKLWSKRFFRPRT
jgi:hypothetical protein